MKTHALATVTGFFIGAAVMSFFIRSPVQSCDHSVLATSIERLEQQIAQANTARCMTVNTPVLNVAVYDVENLKKHKPTYDKPVVKGAANVPEVP